MPKLPAIAIAHGQSVEVKKLYKIPTTLLSVTAQVSLAYYSEKPKQIGS